MFRVCEDAELIYPHVLWLDEPMRAMPQSARRKAFQKTMENLECRRFYFHARGFSGLARDVLSNRRLRKTRWRRLR